MHGQIWKFVCYQVNLKALILAVDIQFHTVPHFEAPVNGKVE